MIRSAATMMTAGTLHPILTCAAAKELETRLLATETAEWDAMQQAGAAIAAALSEDAREIGGLGEEPRLLVLAGKGHNGGDALLAAARLLEPHARGGADVVFPFGVVALRPLARRAWEDLQRALPGRVRVLDLAQLKHEFISYDACLDGVFGFQFRPPLDEPVAELLAWVNTHPRLRVRAAVDLPSGLGDAGNGKTVFRADFTYATGSVKTPLLEPANAPFVGRVRYLDLGFFRNEKPAAPTASPAAVLRAEILRPLAQLRPAQSDKRTYGHLLIVGGSHAYPGAVLMTVQAALRAGVGLLTACVPASLVPEYAARFPEAMWSGFPDEDGGLTPAAVPQILEKAARATALVLGPGLGAAPATLAAAQEIARNTQQPLLLDADALRPEIVAAAAGRPLIVTPHAGEWQRLGGRAGFQPAQGSSPASETIAVLKGYPTRLEVLSGRSQTGPTASSRSCYSFFGGPVLARGGSGDLLAGLIGGLLAQAPDDLWLAAARGVVWHGLAADLLARDRGQVAVQTTQLLDYLQPALHCADHAPT